MDRNKISWLDHPKIILPDEFVPELLEYEDMVVHFVRHAEVRPAFYHSCRVIS